MANTFTTNYGLTKSEIGANNDNWGTDLNNALSSVDTQINRKVDKADIVTQTSNKIAFSGSTITANSTTASTIFENFKAGDVISIAGSSNSANNGNHTINSKTNAYTLVTGTSFTTESEGTTLSYHLVPKYSEVDIDGGTIDGATIATSDITVGSGKTLDVSAGTLTTSTAQKNAIIEGSTTSELGMRFLFKSSADNSSSNLDLDLSSYSYDHYKIVVKGLLPSTDNVNFFWYLGTSSSSFATTDGDYNGLGQWYYWYSFTSSSGSAQDTMFHKQDVMMQIFNVGNGSGGGFTGEFDLFNLHSTSKCSVGHFKGIEYDISETNKFVNSYDYQSTRITATNDSYIRISCSSGNINEGTFSVYGILD